MTIENSIVHHILRDKSLHINGCHYSDNGTDEDLPLNEQKRNVCFNKQKNRDLIRMALLPVGVVCMYGTESSVEPKKSQMKVLQIYLLDNFAASNV